MLYVNNKGSDQTVHQHSLVGNCFVHCFGSIIPIVAKPKISRLSLVSVADQTGLILLTPPKTRFRATRLKLNWS